MFKGTRTQIATYLLVVCPLSITFLVFVNASISFVITDILNVREHVGDDVGTLGFVDELVAMVVCPAWGVLSDKVGPRSVVAVSYTVIAISLFSFVNVENVFPGLLLARILFSFGGAGASTMVTALLPALTSASDNKSTHHPAESVNAISDIDDDEDTGPQHNDEPAQKSPPEAGAGSFRIAGFVGTAAGCGALLAVFGFLRLPVVFQDRQMTAEMALKDTFYIVGSVALLAALASCFGLRNITSKPERGSSSLKQRSLVPYWKSPYSAVVAAFNNHAIGLAYLGGFVARASSVGISLFIPLWINSFYIRSGRCRIDDPANTKTECRDAYRLSSIIVGVSQLAALVCAPLFGIVSERLRQRRAPLLLAAAAGVVGYAALALINDPRIRGGTAGPWIFLVAILIGLSQIGAIVCSLGLLGHAIAQESTASRASTGPGIVQYPRESHTDEDTSAQGSDTAPLLSGVQSSSGSASHPSTGDSLMSIKGSIAGMYSFAGGAGILLLTKVGGQLFDDSTTAAPFWLLAGFNGLLLLGAATSGMTMLAEKLLNRK